ncbi:type II secretion system F family protein [Patescibacteria group bacterium]
MPEFEYEVLTHQGGTKKGNVFAANERTAVQQLQSQGFYIAKIKLKEKGGGLGGIEIGGVSMLSKTLLVEQLAAMMKAGMPLVESLNIIANQSKSQKLKEILQTAVQDVSSGIPLSTSFSKYPETFDKVFIQVLRAGEISGILEKNLRYLGNELRRNYELSQKIKGAMIYPIVIICAMIGVGIALMVFVVPRIAEVLKESGGELPAITVALINVSEFLVDYWWLVIGIIVAIVLFFWWLARRPGPKRVFSAMWLKMPVIKRYKQKVALASFAGTLSNLMRSGMPIVEALSVTGETMKDKLYGDSLQRISDRVKKGVGLVEAFEEESKFFPPIVLGMLRVGERTGEVSVVLQRLSELYENQLMNEIKALISLIEPILMLVVGIAVAILALSIITPIYTVLGTTH